MEHNVQNRLSVQGVSAYNEENKKTDLMKKETHQTRRDDGVPNPDIPCHPLLFEP